MHGIFSYSAVVAAVFVGFAILLVVALLTSRLVTFLQRRKRHGSSFQRELYGKHVVITGGSSGIGLCFAFEAAIRGANVSIIARSKARLEKASDLIRQKLAFPDVQKVLEVPFDITTNDPEVLNGMIHDIVEKQGPVFMLVNCAGFSIPSKLEKLTMAQIRQQMELNFFATASITRAILPAMKASNDGGILVFVSSLAGLFGLYGFTGYSASKFAIRGFAEALAMEVKHHGISVTVSCPPDTDTPGLKEEDKFKPEETKIISQAAGVFQPEDVARGLMEDALNGKFLSSIGMDGFLLTTLCAGMGPASAFDMIVESLLMGILRIIAWFHVIYFNWLVRKYKQEHANPAVNKKTK